MKRIQAGWTLAWGHGHVVPELAVAALRCSRELPRVQGGGGGREVQCSLPTPPPPPPPPLLFFFFFIAALALCKKLLHFLLPYSLNHSFKLPTNPTTPSSSS
ncbi:hypothetical protein NL676_016391 [Syzygium grande]|nr:hypothetical protein NL676_016391 [Syzygium grande]